MLRKRVQQLEELLHEKSRSEKSNIAKKMDAANEKVTPKPSCCKTTTPKTD
jgi:hypothetical protein